MAAALKLTTVGNSTGMVLPKDIMSDLNVKKGDFVYLTKTPDGYLLSPYDEDFARQVDAADDFMRECRDVLRELAK